MCPDSGRYALAFAPVIWMLRLLALGALGIRTVRTPLSNSARISSAWTDRGSVNARWKLP